MSDKSVAKIVCQCLREFLDSTGRAGVAFGENTNLIKGLGLSSDEGVDFVLDLCEALQVELPEDFNPFLDESGKRGLRVVEMVNRVDSIVTRAGAAA